MTKKDLKKYTIIQDCINGFYTVPQAANLLSLSDRQVQRLKKEVKEKDHKVLFTKIEVENLIMLLMKIKSTKLLN